MQWIARVERLPPSDARVLVFSPESGGSDLGYRIMGGEFFCISTDATHWAELSAPAPPAEETWTCCAPELDERKDPCTREAPCMVCYLGSPDASKPDPPDEGCGRKFKRKTVGGYVDVRCNVGAGSPCPACQPKTQNGEPEK